MWNYSQVKAEITSYFFSKYYGIDLSFINIKLNLF